MRTCYKFLIYLWKKHLCYIFLVIECFLLNWVIFDQVRYIFTDNRSHALWKKDITQSSSTLRNVSSKDNFKVPTNLLFWKVLLVVGYSTTEYLEEAFVYSISAKLRRKCIDAKETYPHWKTFDCLIFQTLILISVTLSLFIVPKTENQCSWKACFWLSEQHTLFNTGKAIYSKEQVITELCWVVSFFGTKSRKIMHWWVLWQRYLRENVLSG